MPIHLNISENVSESNDMAKVHHLPCSIKSNDINIGVSTYFEPVVKQTEHDSEVHESSFRGRPIHGKTLNLPKNYTGYVFHEKAETIYDTEDRHLLAGQKFNQITYWNYDKTPKPTDPIASSLNWLKISEAIHTPVINQ